MIATFTTLSMTAMLLMAAMLVTSSLGGRVWRDLTDAEMEEWYSPIDRCVLESTNRFTSAQEIRRNCSHLGNGRWRGCAVGMGSNNFPCYPPYASARKGFRRGVEGYTNHSHTPLVNALRSLAASGSALVLLGDSTMRQKLSALRCELMREDHRSWIDGNLRGILPCHTNITVYFDGGQAIRIHGISIGPNSVLCLKGGLGKRHPHGIFENARDIVRRINEEDQSSTVMLANLGLWYNDELHFQRVIPDVLEWLHNVSTSAHRNTVRWHESMAQHWENLIGSGYYYRPAAEEKERTWAAKGIDHDQIKTDDFQVPNCCTPISNFSRGNDWRNEMVADRLAEMQQQGKGKHIQITPFSDVTTPATDLHICHPTYKFDCTHFCYTPLLWQPMYYDLEIIAQEHLLGSTTKK
jgi:hypothetical protein